MFTSRTIISRGVFSNELRNTGMRGLARATPRRAIGHSTASSGRNATIQQRTRQAYAQGKQTPMSILQQFRSRFFHTWRARRSQVNQSPNPTPNLGSPDGNLSLSQRMRKLSREYGWSALGVYLALSALDFPFCYLLVRYLGADKIGEWEHFVVSNVKRVIPEPVQEKWGEFKLAFLRFERRMTGKQEVGDHVEMVRWGVEEARQQHNKEASLLTQLALAYAIHKSFIFVRVPLAAAITPRVVKTLRGWGWDIGKRTTKEAKALKQGLSSNPVGK